MRTSLALASRGALDRGTKSAITLASRGALRFARPANPEAPGTGGAVLFAPDRRRRLAPRRDRRPDIEAIVPLPGIPGDSGDLQNTPYAKENYSRLYVEPKPAPPTPGKPDGRETTLQPAARLAGNGNDQIATAVQAVMGTSAAEVALEQAFPASAGPDEKLAAKDINLRLLLLLAT